MLCTKYDYKMDIAVKQAEKISELAKDRGKTSGKNPSVFP